MKKSLGTTKNNLAKDDYEGLFRQYIDVCNTAIEKNKDKFYHAEMMKNILNHFDGRTLNFVIYDDRKKGCYALQVKDQKLNVEDDKPSTENNFRGIKLSYLKEVTDNPEKYINRITALDWSWLNSRKS